jgi:putative transposase
MQLVEQHIIKLNNKYYKEIDKLSFLSKNLYNKTNYIVRQEFINSSKLKALGQVDHANYLTLICVPFSFISTI